MYDAARSRNGHAKPAQADGSENAFLACLLLDSDALDAAAGQWEPDQFRGDRQIKAGILIRDRQQRGEPVDPTLIAADAASRGWGVELSPTALAEMMGCVGLTAHWPFYLRHVHAAHRRRQATYKLDELRHRIDQGDDVADVLAEAEGLRQAIDVTPRQRFDVVDSATFAATDYRQRFLIKRVMVAGQPLMVGGPQKAMKTSIIIDAAVSLGTGTPFVGTFDVPEAVNVLVLSGESGGFTLKETAKRICKVKGVELEDARIFWGFDLPKLSNADDLRALEDVIADKDIGVTFIDPAYLCLLSGDTQARQASNVFDMGPLLQQLSGIGERTQSTMSLLHHLRKNRENPFGVPELSDLAFSGFAEWARQWILVGRREAYEPGTGRHNLWLTAGGSAGHSGTWAVDIDEGVPDDDFRGRHWAVTVETATDAIKKQQDEREERKDQRDAEKIEKNRRKIIEALKTLPDGATERTIRLTAHLNAADFAQAFASIKGDEMLEAVEVVASNKQKYGGWKLSARGTEMIANGSAF